MPGRDGSGPVGEGSMTGYCTGYDTPGRGRFGFGRGFQGRRCRGNFYSREFAPLTYQDEKYILRNEADKLQNQLNAVRKRLDEFENQKK